jgi:Histidine kinase-like ATPase domain
MNAGPHLRSRGVAQAGRTATAVRPAHQADRTDCRWLILAAETAGLTRGNGRASPDPCPAGRSDLPRIATRTPGTGAGSVRAARDFTLATLHRWDAADRGDDIAIVVTELLTNALRHARPWPGDLSPRRPIRLGLLQPGSCVLCAVTDPSRAVPVPQGPGSLAETGRGLQIIRALSDMWGYTVLGDAGKVVWAAFIPRPMPPSPAPARVSVGRWARRGWS